MKFTKKTTDKIIRLIREGNYAKVAAQAAGVAEPTFYRWLEDGRAEESGPKREFLESVKKAEAEAQQVHVKNIRKASADNWQASAWWLERKFSDQWGRKDQLRLEVAMEEQFAKMLEHLREKLDEPTYQRVITALAAGGEEGAGTNNLN